MHASRSSGAGHSALDVGLEAMAKAIQAWNETHMSWQRVQLLRLVLDGGVALGFSM